MQKWQAWLDEALRDAIGDGNVAHLPGAGQPLKLDVDDPNVPADLKLAYRIMKDNDIAPGWVGLGMELDGERELILKRADAYARSYRGRVADARRVNSAILERDADNRWQSAISKLIDQIEKYNAKTRDYNAMVPPSIGQRHFLNPQVIIQVAYQRYWE